LDFKDLMKAPEMPDINDPNHYNEDPLMTLQGNKVTSMRAWYPLVDGLPFVPVTILQEIPYRTFLKAVDAVENDNRDNFKALMVEHIQAGLNWLKGGKPLFVRSFMHSAKHEVPTIKIETEDQLWVNLSEIVYESVMKDIPFGGIAFRQFLDLQAPFQAFGGLPIAKERRVFVERADEVISNGHCFQASKDEVRLTITPYWPKKAIQFSSQVGEPIDWRNQLDVLNKMTGKDCKHIEQLAWQIYDRVKHLHPNWSLDFAKDVRGHWWFIDAAAAEQSWRPNKDDF
jgi:hypothetical protein